MSKNHTLLFVYLKNGVSLHKYTKKHKIWYNLN